MYGVLSKKITMKKLIILLFFIPSFAKSQTDSNTVKITVSIQAKDCEYAATLIQYFTKSETLYDAMKAKFRVASPPSNTTLVQLDTIPIGEWFSLTQLIRRDAQGISGGALGRINAQLTALNIPFVTNRIATQDADDTNGFTNLRALGRLKLRHLE